MLQLTHEASALLKDVRRESGAPPDAGVRVQIDQTVEGKEAIRLHFKKDPEPTDQTIETEDLRVFVAKELAEPLSETVLEVRATNQGDQLAFR